MAAKQKKMFSSMLVASPMDIAKYLRELADKIEASRISLGEADLSLPALLEFEIKLEQEHDDDGNTYELEIELSWNVSPHTDSLEKVAHTHDEQAKDEDKDEQTVDTEAEDTEDKEAEHKEQPVAREPQAEPEANESQPEANETVSNTPEAHKAEPQAEAEAS